MTETLKHAVIAAILFSSLPPLGQPLEGGTFQGITTGKDGIHYAVVLVDAKPGRRLSWQDAKAWAESVDGHLPTRPVAALLYDHAKAKLQPEWHWTCDSLEADTGDEDDASYAWCCRFDDGGQNDTRKSAEGAAVAVRLIPLTA
jgi:hypothetical protein